MNPSGEFKRGDVAQLFYTLRGFRPDSTCRAVIQLRPARKSDAARRTTPEFDFVATGLLQSITREVTFTGLKSGGYLLTLTVNGPGGSVMSSRMFRVK